MKSSEASAPAHEYRADIDGLRALCILAVLGFHAGLPGFRGGYIGVDVFFVISGFLITRLLAPHDPAARPTLGTFYLRRTRRIGPVLAAVMLATTLGALWLLLPWELMMYGRFSAWSAVFLANVAAWRDFGYFVPTDTPRPLLHLWSIAVEEQFYLLYPLLLFGLLRFAARAAVWLLAAAAAASLAACVWASYHAPVAGFFLAPARAWELLLGALLAFGVIPAIRSRAWSQAAALAALLTLLATVVLYGPQSRYPGVLTLPVCLAAALLIHTGSQPTLAARLLTLRPLVFTGLISYSLYLWHLPILSFAHYYNIDEPGPLAMAGLLLLSYLLAAACWKFFERPIRSGVRLASNRRFVSVMAGAFAALAIAGYLLGNSDGLPRRFSPGIRAMMDESLGYHRDTIRCLRLSGSEIAAGKLCGFGPASGAPVVVWGDSHAGALLYAYEDLAAANGARVWFAGQSACQPVLPDPAEAAGTSHADKCLAFNQDMLRAIEVLAPRVVILNSYWMSPASGPGRYDDLDAAQRAQRLRARLEYTLRRPELARSTVCVVRDPPVLPHDAAYVMAMSERRGIDAAHWEVSAVVARGQDAEFAELLRSLQARGQIAVADLKAPLCRSERCEMRRGGVPLYIDNHHLSSVGAHLMTETLQNCLAPIAQRP